MPHVFVSHVRNNRRRVQRLCNDLTKHGVKIWLARNDIKPGTLWQDAIEEAIQEGAFFIACFSKEYNERDETYMNKELTLAIDRLHGLSTDRIWLIPVKLNRCKVPKRRISDIERLTSLQYIELYRDWDAGVQSILDVIQPIPPNVQRLMEVLDSGDMQVRIAAITALGSTGHHAAVPALIEALSDEHEVVRRGAASALGEIGDPTAVPALIEALGDKSWFVSEMVASALGEIGDPTAVPALIEVLCDAHSLIRSKVASALRNIGTPEALVLLKP